MNEMFEINDIYIYGMIKGKYKFFRNNMAKKH